jgi:uncharacterized protein (DUF2249 family)/iron-sulfur cluster repair protein YtfE (RIC family)
VNTLVLATSEREAAAVDAVVQHHAAMAGTLSALAERLVVATDNEQAATARDELVHWSVTELVPHAKAEESVLYPLAHQDGSARLLVDAMLVEHELILGLVEQLQGADTAVRAAALATALRVAFESHLAKENDQILPLLAAAPGVSVATALDGMHALLGEADANDEHAAIGETAANATSRDETSSQGHGHGGACGCGEVDGPELPELDARAVPHAIRHATVFGALDAVRPGGGLVLVAPHDPLPLLKQIEARTPGVFEVDYLERGPEAWRLRFVRG